MAPLVSLIMPAKLRSPQDVVWMREAIESILEQDNKNWELLVVNDHSEVSMKPLADYFTSDDRISGLKARGYGPAHARNQAAEASTSGLLLPIDHDDKAAPEAIKLMLGGWGQCNNGVIYGDTILFGENSSKLYSPPKFTPKAMLEQLLMPVFGLHSKAAWAKVGGWSPQLEQGLEDWEYYLKLMEIGECGHHIEGVTYYYRKHPGSRISTLLTSDNGYHLAYSKMRDMHIDLFSGRTNVVCGGCQGQAGANTPQQPSSTTMTAVEMAQLPADSRVRVAYIGNRSGTFYVTGRPSMAQYEVALLGRTRELVGMDGKLGVLPSDIRFILSLDGGHTFKRIS